MPFSYNSTVLCLVATFDILFSIVLLSVGLYKMRRCPGHSRAVSVSKQCSYLVTKCKERSALAFGIAMWAQGLWESKQTQCMPWQPWKSRIYWVLIFCLLQCQGLGNVNLLHAYCANYRACNFICIVLEAYFSHTIGELCKSECFLGVLSLITV